MIRALVEQTFDSTKKYFVLAGLSTDSKPTSGVITGSKFLEVDTGVNYAFDEVNNQWTAFTITEQEIKDEIDAWLDEHPEATTTVEDGAISRAKLDDDLKAKTDEVPDLKSAIDIMSDEEKLFNASIPGTTETVTFSNDNPVSIVHTANNSAVRTDTFVWTDTTVTETRTLANGKYVTLATNLETLVTVISEIQEAA